MKPKQPVCLYVIQVSKIFLHSSLDFGCAFIFKRPATKESAVVKGLTWGFITCFVRGIQFQIYTILAFAF